jgi:hypothetical protein
MVDDYFHNHHTCAVLKCMGVVAHSVVSWVSYSLSQQNIVFLLMGEHSL